MDISEIKLSFAGSAFLSVTNMRNLTSGDGASQPNICTTIAKRFTAGVVYAILPLVGIVEAVVRGILAIPVYVASCCCENECVSELWDMMANGAMISGMTGYMSVAAFFFNFTKDNITKQDLDDAAPCLKGG